jgi:hypothetical protein
LLAKTDHGPQTPGKQAKATKRATGKQWTPIHTPLGKSNYPLEPEIKERQVKGIKEYMVRYPFDTSKTIIVEHTISRGLKKKDGQFQQQNEDSVSGTVETYMQILKHLGNFASRIGDYRTVTRGTYETGMIRAPLRQVRC